MANKHTLLIGSMMLGLSLLSGCSMEEESLDVDKLIEEKDGFTIDVDQTPIIFFTQEGMTILNADYFDNLEGGYPLPFLPDQLYEEPIFTHTDDWFQIEAEGITYDLTVLGPRRFLDEENNLEFNTSVYLNKNMEESE